MYRLTCVILAYEIKQDASVPPDDFLFTQTPDVRLQEVVAGLILSKDFGALSHQIV